MATDKRWLIGRHGDQLLRIGLKHAQPSAGDTVEAWEYARGPQHVIVIREKERNTRFVYYIFERSVI